VDVVIGTQNIKRLPMLVERATSAGASAPIVDIDPLDDVSFPLGVARRLDPAKAYVTIIEGCNEFCAFCVVPYTRGHERMRPASAILAEARQAVSEGALEIQLLGQIVNHYQAPDDPACDFAGLLERLNLIEGLERIRFASPHPRHVTNRMVQAMRQLPKVCRHLHLPVQSGSTRVLGAMRRRHTREDYLELVARLRDAMPDIALSTDMIVGFPGETESDFEDTLSLTAAVRYHSMFSFKYSPRPNTLALKRLPDDVSEGEKTRRIVALQSLQREIQGELYRQSIGREERVLVESRSRRRASELSGRTGGNTVVNFAGDPDWIGRLVRVRVTEANPNSLRAEAMPA
jgi:tRNA-2-methylthio-N6-dimethylallyladenosine synthase